MSYSRRNFLKSAALFAGGTSLMNALPVSFQTLQKAMAINPDKGTTYKDAEHVVLLMQENRSFDHVFGSLKGVRGLNDPRTIRLPNHNLAWLQMDFKGDTYLPYRLDIKDSKVTWIGGLPHQWGSQVDARNEGRYDKWLEAKKYNDEMPFTLGQYTRPDLPFYYALADAFTVSDQHFCSSLTGTTPNRLYYWSGTVREEQRSDSPANISNAFVNYSNAAHWETFPEILEDQAISWKIYQNELSVGVGLEDEEVAWLENFTNNPLEWFAQYHVRFHPAHIKHLRHQAEQLKKDIADLKDGSDEKKKKEDLRKKILEGLDKYSAENFEKLSAKEQALHQKAFTTNVNDPLYHDLTEVDYDDNGESRTLNLPKGDPLYQFREDVENGELPTVSWLIGSQRFSDHPSSPWFGSWYTSEVLKTLTDNPEVWKKTIFILCYDENDGYFDHIPPFTAPNPEDSKSGFCSDGIDSSLEYVTQTQADNQKGTDKEPGRVSPIGLGYRVPFVVASPWSRGGKANSQLSDNTSVLMFLEKFLSQKTGKSIKTDNISNWRRTICSDLTSIFEPYNGETIELPEFLKKVPFSKQIYNAKFKEEPKGYRKLTEKEIAAVNEGDLSLMPEQEKGTRRADALPYELYADTTTDANGQVQIEMTAGDQVFGQKSAGVAFYVYNNNPFAVRNYAIKPGDTLTDQWKTKKGVGHLHLYGPNGFHREIKRDGTPEHFELKTRYEHRNGNPQILTGNLKLQIKGNTPLEIIDNAYGRSSKDIQASPEEQTLIMDLQDSQGWYDYSIQVKGNNAKFDRIAGHVETGKASMTDPYMGGEV